jgi:predicted nuclease of predicted toxin-antitoxin system
VNLYLDDCAFSHNLVRLLQEAGHSVVTPADAGLTGRDDDVHLGYAIRQGLVLLTKNPSDFLDLHNNLQRRHPGILAIGQDNDVNKDMSDGDVVRAIRHVVEVYLPACGGSLAGDYQYLNDWQWHDTEPVARPAAPPSRQERSRKDRKGKK